MKGSEMAAAGGTDEWTHISVHNVVLMMSKNLITHGAHPESLVNEISTNTIAEITSHGEVFEANKKLSEAAFRKTQ